MRAKKILFFIAGLVEAIIGALGILFGGLMLALKGLLKTAFNASYESVQEIINEIGKEEKFSYLLTASKEECINFIIKYVQLFGFIFLVMGLIWAMFAVFNFLLTSVTKYNAFKDKKWLKIMFVIGIWVLMPMNVANILTTIAVFLKEKQGKQEKLYSALEQ
ncbi:MAG: hypothetical protein IJW59_02640 [Clostridia bacterium]|nr:hypothetical protein [Clostridia bacterium]